MCDYRSEIDIVLMDIDMPVLRGDEVTQQYRKWEATEAEHGMAPLKIFAYTAIDFSQGDEGLTAMGFDACLRKPVQIDDLKELIQSCDCEARRVIWPSTLVPTSLPFTAPCSSIF